MAVVKSASISRGQVAREASKRNERGISSGLSRRYLLLMQLDFPENRDAIHATRSSRMPIISAKTEIIPQPVSGILIKRAKE